MSVYVDYASTTPFDKEIMEKVMAGADVFGNPSSIHRVGKDAKAKLQAHRTRIAESINAKPKEIIITSGATEANNLAIKGTAGRHEKPHMITTDIEHASVRTTYQDLSEQYDVTFLKASENGLIDVDDLKKSLQSNTVLVSIMLVNNETGSIQPVYEIAKVLKDHQALFHIDAVQAFGHMEVNVHALGADMLTLSGHKIYGPKGIGMLYLREGTKLSAQITGGSHELSRRAGTENTMWVEALALAMEKADSKRAARSLKEMQLKERFLNELTAEEIPFEVNGDVNRQASHIVNLHFPWSEAEFLLTALDMTGVYVSAGSACNAGTVQPSHVIQAMYGDEERALKSIRFSFSHLMEEEDILEIVSQLKAIYERLYGN
ncbi:cysteine desulfurase family protein [Salinicoccus halitifaciens]|uniref:Cysteine desulfurase n=1 Tax=Salinicoccus halitifaciens TaxID=1073415 RepID=A0ABV2E6T2_9STAP|nr:cysteine desulfurase family protein [Salinicoccus halitifaciens]MCD2136811.1 cysteine desulfurase [Salinicoccus halitifaciens]